MKSSAVAALGLSALLLAGCGSTMRNYLEKDAPAEQQASARQDLTMPPDLRLPPPGSAPSYAETAAAPAQPSVYDDEIAAAAPAKPKAPAAQPYERPMPGDDVYKSAGISKFKPDGTRKTDAELREELRAYYIAQKKQKNANYGTVFNMGNIFKDE